jgi:hypothetical protein
MAGSGIVSPGAFLEAPGDLSDRGRLRGGDGVLCGERAGSRLLTRVGTADGDASDAAHDDRDHAGHDRDRLGVHPDDRASAERADTERADTHRASTERASTERADTQRPDTQRAGAHEHHGDDAGRPGAGVDHRPVDVDGFSGHRRAAARLVHDEEERPVEHTWLSTPFAGHRSGFLRFLRLTGGVQGWGQRDRPGGPGGLQLP